MAQNYDVIIAGGGLSGVLTACKILSALPNARILVLEKEKNAGGRLRTSCPEESKWSFGINTLAPFLADFLEGTIKEVFPDFDINQYDPIPMNEFAQLSASKLSKFGCEEVLRPASAKAMGGRNAGKEFAEVESLIIKSEDEKFSDDRISKLLKLKRKSPGAVVLEHQASAFGIPDIWNSGLELLRVKAETYRAGLVKGKWDLLCDDVLESLSQREGVDVIKSCHIISATRLDNVTTLKSEKGEFACSSLVVAQNPWAAHGWLDKELFPVSILNLILKSKPVSLVTLSCLNNSGLSLPDMTLVPAEKTQVVSYENSVTFQATIDYELSLTSLEVVKAVKRLRRARKRIEQYLDDSPLDREFVALLPCAWPLPAGISDRKLVSKLTNEALNGGGIQFCGDTYGTSLEGDANILSSVKYATLSSLKDVESKGLLHDKNNRRKDDLGSNQRESET